MFDLEGLSKALDRDRRQHGASRGGGSRAFEFAAPAQFANASFQCRFLPAHPTRCQAGWRIVRYHQIEVTPGNYVYVLDRPEGTFTQEVLESFRQIPESKIPKSVREVLESLALRVQYLFPMLWKAEVAAVPGVGLTEYRPSAERLTGVIWQVKALTLVDKIRELVTAFPDLNDAKSGRWVTFSKAHRDYNLVCNGEPCPLDERCLKLLDQYPNIDGMYRKWEMDRAKEQALLRASWFASMLEKFVDLSD